MKDRGSELDSQYFADGQPPLLNHKAAYDVETIAHALTNIYRRNVDVDHDIEPYLYEETQRIMDEAIAEGYANAAEKNVPTPDEAFRNAFGHSADVFSAFRVHKMQTDIAAQMLDSDGHLKPFSKFVKDVSPYIEHRNRAWLQTEYDTAIIRAQNAAEWQQFQAEKDVFPNLEWIPSTSPNPGADHQVFWGTVLPVDDPFWNEHKPGDRWNCKCELRQTDRDSTPVPSSDGKSDAAPGLESNPATDREPFSDRHPYYPSGCSSCPFAGNRLSALVHDLAGRGKHCNDCVKVDSVIKPRGPFEVEGKRYGKTWTLEYTDPQSHGYIVKEDGHGAQETAQNIKSAKPLAKSGFRVELIKQDTIQKDGQKKKIKTRDANVNDEKWEFKYTADYINLAKSIGTKAKQVVEQGADVMLIDIHKNRTYGKYLVVLGVKNSFKYNPTLQKVCVMLESNLFLLVERKQYEDGTYINNIKKWLTD